jgi:ADP-ribose pyrophosphatase
MGALVRLESLTYEQVIMEILSLEKLTNEKWLNLFAATFRNRDHTGRWLFASRKPDPHAGQGRADAVVIVPTLVNPGEPPRLVVINEFRVPISGRVFGFPAGLLEPGESVEDAARREMAEETGFDVVKVKRVSPAVYASSGMTDEAAALAFVDVRSTPDSKPHLEAGEDLEVVLWDFAEVCKQCDAPDAPLDTRVWMVLNLCQLLGRII